MWQRDRGNKGCRQRGKGSPRWEVKSCQFASQLWPHGSHQPCALYCSLQLPLATVWQSLCSPWFAHQHQKTEVAPVVSAERGLLTNPCQPAQPQSLQLGGGAASPPPSTPPSPGPGKWVCGSRTDAGAFPGAVSCAPCQGRGLAAPPLCRGAPRCHAHLLCLLRLMLLVLCPPRSGPCRVPHYQPARLSQTPHTTRLTLGCLALPCVPSSALPGWWHNAGCPEQGDRNNGWAPTFLMLL